MTKQEKLQQNKILFIDTSTTESLAAVSVDDRIICQKSWSDKSDLSEKLLLNIDWLLCKAAIGLPQLSTIAVNRGPGSYTGLRIGLSIANTLSWSLCIPLVEAKIVDGSIKCSGKKSHRPLLPVYSSPPKISRPKQEQPV